MSLEELQAMNTHVELRNVAILLGTLVLLSIVWVYALPVYNKLRDRWNGWQRRRRRGRDKEMKISREMQEYICDTITVALEEAVYSGRFARERADNMYRNLAKKNNWPDLIPKRLMMKRQDVVGLKRRLKKMNKDAAKALKERQEKGATEFKDWAKSKDPDKSNNKVERVIAKLRNVA